MSRPRLSPEARQYLAEAKRIQRRIDALDELRERRREVWLRANRAGVSYPLLVEELGVSEGLVCKEIARARAEVGDPSLAAPAPRSRPRLANPPRRRRPAVV